MPSGTSRLLAYNPALDGLRGIAILAVMVFHATPNLLIGGFIGVDIFFALSGFLITTLLIREQELHCSINLKNFYLRRILRLGPALMLVLSAFAVLSLLTLSGDRQTQFLIDALISFFYLTNWARAFDIHPPDFLGHTWSLAIEEQFYLLWPAVLMVLMKYINNRLYWLALTVLIALASAAWRFHLLTDATPMRIYNGLDTRADALMLGCALAITASLNGVRRCLAEHDFRWLSKVAVWAMIGLISVALTANWDSPRMLFAGYFLVAALSVIVIGDLQQTCITPLKTILSFRLLVWIGTISYGLYLWHFPIFRTLLALGMAPSAVLLFGSFLTLLTAAASYYFIEQPVLKLKHRLQMWQSGCFRSKACAERPDDN